jgi:hypothetical protein
MDSAIVSSNAARGMNVFQRFSVLSSTARYIMMDLQHLGASLEYQGLCSEHTEVRGQVRDPNFTTHIVSV